MIILVQKGSKIYPNTNLPITLWLKYNDKQEIIYMQNNYNKYTTGDDLIPISIDKYKPKLLEEVKLNVKEKDFKKVLNFIKEKYQILIDTVNGVGFDYSIMEHTDINRFKPTVIDGFFVNGISARDYPSLPVDLFLYCDVNEYDDERDLYTLLMQNTHQHNKRFEDYVTVSIDKENPKLVYDVQLGISKEEFKRVQDFIKRHYDFLKEYTERNDMDIKDIHDYLSSWETEPWLIDSINGYSIYLYVGDYESYPHFHFVDEETKGKKFNACIKIDKAEYFNHSLNRNDKLNKKQKEDLQKLLETPFRKTKYAGTNYELIKDMWNMNYDNKISESLEIPNYINLKITIYSYCEGVYMSKKVIDKLEVTDKEFKKIKTNKQTIILYLTTENNNFLNVGDEVLLVNGEKKIKRKIKNLCSYFTFDEMYENVFNRLLVGDFRKIVDTWYKKGYNKDIILLALKESLDNDVINVRYTDLVLQEWRKKGILDNINKMTNTIFIGNKKIEKEDINKCNFLVIELETKIYEFRKIRNISINIDYYD